jgi:hypothetical protein
MIKITIPISNYEGNGVFEKELYFERMPSLEELRKILQEEHQKEVEYSKDPEYGYHYANCFEYQECLEVLQTVSLDLWAELYVGNGVMMSSRHINHPKFGKQSICCKVITIFKI